MLLFADGGVEPSAGKVQAGGGSAPMERVRIRARVLELRHANAPKFGAPLLPTRVPPETLADGGQ